MINPRYLILLLFSASLMFVQSCGSPNPKNEAEETTEVVLPSVGAFGDAISKEGAVPVSEIASLITTDDAIPVKVSGTIVEVCQHSGCWLTLDLGQGQTIQVNMKDHAYSVPKDASGKKVWVEGEALRELISVELLKHYAEDAGRSREYVDSITQDEWQYTIEAKGVIIEE